MDQPPTADLRMTPERQPSNLTFWRWPGENALVLVAQGDGLTPPAPGMVRSTVGPSWLHLDPSIEAAIQTPTAFLNAPDQWAEAAAKIRLLYRSASKGHQSHIRKTIEYLQQAIPEGPAAIDLVRIAQFQSLIDSQKRKPITRNNYTRSASAVCGWLVHFGYLHQNPFECGRKARRLLFLPESETDVRALTTEEVRAILAQSRREAAEAESVRDQFVSRRLNALVHLLAYTGVRAGEALRARTEDITDGLFWVRAREHRVKTARSEAPVPLPPAAEEVLRAWMADPLRTTARRKHRLLLGKDRTCLFPTMFEDKPWMSGGPRMRPLDQVAALARRAGIEWRVNLKTFRHSWATQAEAWGFGVAAIQRVLRHTNVTTQRRYRKADLANLAAWGKQVRFG